MTFEETPDVIELDYFQGGADGKSDPVVRLSKGEERCVVPREVVRLLYGLIPLKLSIRPELMDLLRALSAFSGPSDEGLEDLAIVLSQADDSDLDAIGVEDPENVFRLEDARLARRGLISPNYALNRLTNFMRSEGCTPLLASFITRLIDALSKATLAEEQSTLNVRLRACLEYGTRAYTAPETRSVIGDVVLAFNRVFERVVTYARGKIYHLDDLHVLFSNEAMCFHPDARLKLVVPMVEGEDPGDEKAMEMLLVRLLVGNHLDEAKTRAVLVKKIAEADVLRPEEGLRQITLNAYALQECGLSQDKIRAVDH